MILKTKRFTLRLSPQDREIFACLAAQLQRTESDALRVVAREKVAAMKGVKLLGEPENSTKQVTA